MRNLFIILFLCFGNALCGQDLKDGIYIVFQPSEPGIRKQVMDSKDSVTIGSTTHFPLSQSIEATATFDEKHQPMLAIKFNELAQMELISLMKEIHSLSNSDEKLALVINSQILTIASPRTDEADSRLLFTGVYSYEETKRMAATINKAIPNYAPKTKQQTNEEALIEKEQNKLMDAIYNKKGTSDIAAILDDQFLFRMMEQEMLFTKETFLENIIGKTEDAENIDIDSKIVYYYWNETFTFCETNTAIWRKDQTNISHQQQSLLFSWIKTKKGWKLWRMTLL